MANEAPDEMPAEYRRRDLGPIVRGKYAARHSKAGKVILSGETSERSAEESYSARRARGLKRPNDSH